MPKYYTPKKQRYATKKSSAVTNFVTVQPTFISFVIHFFPNKKFLKNNFLLYRHNKDKIKI